MPMPPMYHLARRSGSKAVARAIAAALVLQPTLPLHAQAVVDVAAASSRKPLLDRASNGVQIVHIAPANASKVSHNLFTQFSVPAAGLVLNNSTAPPQPVNTAPPPPAPPPPAPPPPPPPPGCYGICYDELAIGAPALPGSLRASGSTAVSGGSTLASSNTTMTGSSQLAGGIGGNVLFAGNAAAQARLIVAEVSAANPSNLNGQIEVFGAGADLVVANPYGISCNGCGFVNVGRASLVTGSPQYNGTALSGFSVSGGQISVGGSGLDAPGLASLDLLAGSLSLQAPLRVGAGNSALLAVIGANQINYESLAATAQARAGAVPATVIDLGAAGGMVANQIYLVSTEAGAGVNLRGMVEAGSGGFTLDAAGNLLLGGSQKSGGALVLSGKTVSGGGQLESSGLTLVQAQDSLQTSSLEAKAGDLMLAAGGDLKLNGGALQASGDLRLSANGKLEALAVPMLAGLDAALTSAGDLVLGVTASRSDRTDAAGVRTEETRYNRSSITATGGSVALQSTNGVVVVDGSRLDAGKSIAVQGLGVALQARKDMVKTTATSGNTTTSPSSETLIGASLYAKDDIALLAHGTGLDQGHLLLAGARVESDSGHVSLLAAKNLDVAHDITTDKTWERFYQMKRKWYGGKEITEIISSTLDETVNPSEVSGRSISMGAGAELNVVGSAVFADGAVGLHADGDLNLLSTSEAHYAYESRYTKKSGIFSSGGLSITIGSKSKTEIVDQQEIRQASSSVSSLAGDILATAGNQYLQLSSDLVAPQGDIHVSARNIAIQSNNNTRSVLNIVRERQSGVTLSASHPLISAALTIKEMEKVRKRTQNGRYQALALLTSGLTIYNHFGDFAKLTEASPQQALNGFRFNISLGSSKSDYESLQDSSTPLESSLNAGRDISLTATGGGDTAQADSGDISLVGTRVSASRNISLNAARDITLAAAVGTNSETTKRKSSSASIGLGFSLGGQTNGFTLELAASRSNAWSNGWGTTYFNTELAAAEQLSLSSGRHSTLAGAKASGKALLARVGTAGSGNLTLSSPIDEQHYKAREESVGFSASIPIPGLSAGPGSFSLNINQLQLIGDYEAVRQQTALLAGRGGFDINVNGHTQLQGAAISSEAGAHLSRLSSQTLTHEDVVNKDVVAGKSRSVGITASVSKVDGQVQTKLGGSAIGYARIDTNQSNTTVSSIAPATLSITRPDLQANAANQVKAGQREPLATQLGTLQAQLAQLLENEPPSCSGCHVQGAPLDPLGAAQTSASVGQAESPAPGKPGMTALWGDTNPDWTDWNNAVRALEGQINGLETRISAINARQLKGPDGLSRSPDGLHQPLLHTFDSARSTQELRDGVALTVAFGKVAFKTVGDYSETKKEEALRACGTREVKDCAAAKPWDEGGIYKIALHAAIGGMALGSSGVLGAGAGQAAQRVMSDEFFEHLGIADANARNLLRNLGATAAGYAAGQAQGLAAAFTGDANNRQLHPDIQRFVRDGDRVRRYMEQNPHLSYTQAEQELARTAAVLNGSDWAAIHGDSATESARQFLMRESVGLLLPDNTTYFTPSKKDFEDAKKFLVEAWEGDIFSLKPELLRARPGSWAAGLKGVGAGGLDGAMRWIQATWEDIQSMPEDARAVYQLMERAKVDPQAVATALELALERAGPELRRVFLENEAMAKLLQLQGDVRGATSLATLGALTVFDPTGKLIKGAKLSGDLAKYAAEAISHADALKVLDSKVGISQLLPDITALVRNNGLQAEALAAVFSKQLGVDVKVLQNASGHGVDLYAFDATTNRYIVIEVKSSANGSFGAPPAGGAEDFLRTRADRAAQGTGFWASHNVPPGLEQRGKDIRDNLQQNGATVVGYKYEISIPKPGQTGAPVLTVKRWGP